MTSKLATFRLAVKPTRSPTAQSIADILNGLHTKGDVVFQPTTGDDYNVLVTTTEALAITSTELGYIVVYLTRENVAAIKKKYAMTGLVVGNDVEADAQRVSELVLEAAQNLLSAKRLGDFITALPSALEQSKSTSVHTLKHTLGLYEHKQKVTLEQDLVILSNGGYLSQLAVHVPVARGSALVKLCEEKEGASTPTPINLSLSEGSIVILATSFHASNMDFLDNVRKHQANKPSARTAVVFFDKVNFKASKELLHQLVADGLDQINHRAHLSSINTNPSIQTSTALVNAMAKTTTSLPLGSGDLLQTLVTTAP